jgi:hypothetical protein
LLPRGPAQGNPEILPTEPTLDSLERKTNAVLPLHRQVKSTASLPFVTMYASDDLRLSEFYKSVKSSSWSCSNKSTNVLFPCGRYHVPAPVAEESLSSRYNSQNEDSHTGHSQLPRDLGIQVTQVASPDTTLTAFCQLAAIQLGVQRCGISLIGRYQQYILAESTRTTNLAHTTKSDDPEDSLWLGMTEVSQGHDHSAPC